MYENILVETYIGRKQIVIARRLLQLVGASAYWQQGKSPASASEVAGTTIWDEVREGKNPSLSNIFDLVVSQVPLTNHQGESIRDGRCHEAWPRSNGGREKRGWLYPSPSPSVGNLITLNQCIFRVMAPSAIWRSFLLGDIFRVIIE